MDNGRLRGRGTDSVGSYNLDGVWGDDGIVALEKTYSLGTASIHGTVVGTNQGHIVSYRGAVVSEGAGRRVCTDIAGSWRVRFWSTSTGYYSASESFRFFYRRALDDGMSPGESWGKYRVSR